MSQTGTTKTTQVRVRLSRSSPAATALFSILCLTMAAGQQAGPHQDTYYVIGTDQKLIAVPSIVGTTKARLKGFGIGGAKGSTEVPGTSAAVRLKPGAPQRFVATLEPRAAAEALQPSGASPTVRLYRLDVKKRTREWTIFDATSSAQPGQTSMDDNALAVNLSKYAGAPDSLQIEPRSPLGPGEYAFVTIERDAYQRASFRLHCFGVD